MVAIVLRFLKQNNGVLSKRILNKEFSALKEEEIKEIEANYRTIFIEK